MGGLFPSNVRLEPFIKAMRTFGLPVKFLEFVSNNYTIRRESPGGGSHVKPVLNILYLDPSDLASIKDVDPALPLGEAVGILNVYHEATHAYFDLKENDPDVSKVRKEALAYYTNAPLTGGGKASDPERVFQEAAGSYVGHRASSWWSALVTLTVLQAKPPSASNNANWMKMAKGVPKTYDRNMGQRVFGYQDVGYFPTHQVSTTKAVPGVLKTYCDRVILEGKIPDSFLQAKNLQKRHTDLTR